MSLLFQVDGEGILPIFPPACFHLQFGVVSLKTRLRFMCMSDCVQAGFNTACIEP